MQRTQRTVVVVDDDRDLRDLLELLLVDEGYRAVCIGEADLDRIRTTVEEDQPACLLLDSCGPDGSPGFGAAWQVAAWLHDNFPTLPVAMFTGHAADAQEAKTGETERAKLAAFAAIVPKPFDTAELLAALDSLMRGPRVVRQPRERTTNRRSRSH